jgi:hypothetical protein
MEFEMSLLNILSLSPGVEEKAAAERMSHRTDALWMKVGFREGCLPVDQARREVAR